MSQAPSIPNLLTMRGGPRSRGGVRGGRGSQGRGLLGKGAPMPPPGAPLTPEQAAIHDKIIQQTDTDALHSRISAIKAGYLEDEYSALFTMEEIGRRLPIINRGTYVRTSCVDLLVDKFLTATPGRKQIVSLGAGTDTRYFRLMDQKKDTDLYYHEIDFPTISANKLAAIRSTRELSSSPNPFAILNNPKHQTEPYTRAWGFSRSGDHHQGYNFHPIDLRDLKMGAPPDSFRKIDPRYPTLIISECCLCYLEKQAVDQVLQFFINKLEEPGIILYEPTSPFDDFGQMMFKNLSLRGLSMPTVGYYPTLELQQNRLKDAGFKVNQAAADIDWLWEHWISAEEKRRVNALEGLDEVEEWQMLARHYCIAFGYSEKTKAEGGSINFKKAWGKLPRMVNNRGVEYPDMDESDEEMGGMGGQLGTPTPTEVAEEKSQ